MISKTAFLIIFFAYLVNASDLAGFQNTDQRSSIVAVVDGFPISRSAAIGLMERAFPLLLPLGKTRFATDNDSLDDVPSINPVLLNSAIDQLIDRRVVYLYLVNQGKKISQSDLSLEIELLRFRLENEGRSLAEYLGQLGISQQELEFEIAWEIAWTWYTARILTDSFLKEHYDQHRYRFDDSEIRVAHLLVKFDPQTSDFSNGADNSQTPILTANQNSFQSTASGLKPNLNHQFPTNLSRSMAQQFAQNLFDRLQDQRPNSDQINNDGSSAKYTFALSHPIDWEVAVARFSHAPSKNQTGEIGWIQFSHPMPPVFSEAAFRLRPGEVSPPVETPFGFHLIRCLEIKPGKTQFGDAIVQVRQAAQKELFQKIANAYRPHVKITPISDESP